MINVDSTNFEAEVLNSNVPVVVDFWAPWCEPCRILTPILEELAKEITTVKFVKLNTDENPDLAKQFKVKGIPLLILFEKGAPMRSNVGLTNKDNISEFILGINGGNGGAFGR